MTFGEFLDLTKILRLLYGVQIASSFFENNIANYYNLDYNKLQINIKKESDKTL